MLADTVRGRFTSRSCDGCRLGDAFAFADLEVERLPLDELTVAVVTPRTLYRMKKDTLRLKDRADAEMLRRRFGIESD